MGQYAANKRWDVEGSEVKKGLSAGSELHLKKLTEGRSGGSGG